MIQNLSPDKLFNEYKPQKISENDYVLVFKGANILCKIDEKIKYPKFNEIEKTTTDYIYLFRIGEQNFYLNMDENIKISSTKYSFEKNNILRSSSPKSLAFAGLTAYHLYNFYRNHKVCGQCGKTLEFSKDERMLYCNDCNNFIYPSIAPVVIVAVTDGEKLLMTKYANREYTRYSLVAGFVEIGETAEEAVKRELMEEVGVKVKNIRYYKSQPWGFSSSLLLGFTAELDGSPEICLDQNELSEAVWVDFDDIEMKLDDFSLTNEMICMHKK